MVYIWCGVFFILYEWRSLLVDNMAQVDASSWQTKVDKEEADSVDVNGEREAGEGASREQINARRRGPTPTYRRLRTRSASPAPGAAATP
jgi:hypothetical protein